MWLLSARTNTFIKQRRPILSCFSSAALVVVACDHVADGVCKELALDVLLSPELKRVGAALEALFTLPPTDMGSAATAAARVAAGGGLPPLAKPGRLVKVLAATLEGGNFKAGAKLQSLGFRVEQTLRRLHDAVGTAAAGASVQGQAPTAAEREQALLASPLITALLEFLDLQVALQCSTLVHFGGSQRGLWCTRTPWSKPTARFSANVSVPPCLPPLFLACAT